MWSYPTVKRLEPNATIVVSEVKAPTGYILDQTPKNIVVRSGVANSLIFDDQPGTTLVIRKYIEGTDYESLAGVAFKVTDGSGAAVGPDDGVYYTDLSGEIVLEGIEPGTTVIARGIKTVEGYASWVAHSIKHINNSGLVSYLLSESGECFG